MGIFGPPNIAKLEAKGSVGKLIQALGDGAVRLDAVRSLGALGDARAVEPLIPMLGVVNPEIRSATTRALARIGMPAVEPLISALNDDWEFVRVAAAEALGTIGDPRSIEPLVSALNDDSESVSKGAGRALGKIGAPATEFLIAALKDQNESVRVTAARTLGTIGDPRSVEPLIAALKDTKESVRATAARVLGALGDARAVEPLAAALKDKKESVRATAARVLGALGDARAVEPLIAVLRGSIASADRDTAGLLARIGPPAVEPLIATLGDENMYARGAAMGALREMGLPAVDPLIAALGDPVLRRPAATALSEIGEPTVEPLIAALNHRSDQVRNAAASALARIGDARAIEPLLATLTDESGDEGAPADGVTGRQLQHLGTQISILPMQHPGPGMGIGCPADERKDRQAREQIPTICQNIEDAVAALGTGRDPYGNPISRGQVGDGLQNLIKATGKAGWKELVSVVLSPQGLKELRKHLRELEAIARDLASE